jgi:predicted transcriptional regulator
MTIDDRSSNDESNLAELTAQIVSAFVSRNAVEISEVPDLIVIVSDALKKRMGQQEAEPEPLEPAVPIRRSVKPDSITCLECGTAFKSLKRHLRVEHQLEPDDYRAKWGLKNDYPMVAPNYAEARSKLARDMGLGRKLGEAAKGKAAGSTKGKGSPPTRARQSSRVNAAEST